MVLWAGVCFAAQAEKAPASHSDKLTLAQAQAQSKTAPADTSGGKETAGSKADAPAKSAKKVSIKAAKSDANTSDKKKSAGKKADTPAKTAQAKDAKAKAAAACLLPIDTVAKTPVVTDVQVYSGRDYSRIVLVLSGPARHHWQILPPDPKEQGVRRLYVDLDDAVVRRGVPARFDVRGEVARKVRLSHFKPGVLRLVVEVENLKNQQVFMMDNPSRLIVDVQGEASGKDAAVAAKPETSRPVAPEKNAGKTRQGKSEKKGRDAAAASAGHIDKPGLPGINLTTPSRKRMASQLVEQFGLTVRTVMVDAGHGGRDSGARGVGGLWEKNVNLQVAKLLGKQLEKMGFEVLYTRTTDKYVPLEARTAMANALKADLFVSVHCNAHGDPKSTGMETYSLNLASTPDEVRVAARENSVDPRCISDLQKLLDALIHASKLTESRDFAKSAHAATLSQARKSLDLRDRGVHEAPFYVLLGAKMPAILVEIGYITNPAEGAKLKDEKYLDGLARGIAEGVKAYKERIERFADKG
ncbi:MAG: N-acetylmuramoyl-L-alanine amidase [Acidobacteriota bacterium]